MRKKIFLSVLVVGLALMPVLAQNQDPLEFEHVPDQLLVKFQPDTDPSIIAAINGQIGSFTSLDFRLDPDLRLVQLREGSDLREGLNYYKLQPEVRFAEPNFIYHTQLTPNDAQFGSLWGMNNTGQSGGLVGFDIDAAAAWDSHTSSPGIIIGSIDTGVDVNHEDLSANIWVNPGEIPGNFVDDDANGFIDDVNGWDFVNNDSFPFDDHDHGSHTMGTAAGQGNNGIGVAGVTWTASIMSIKVCNQFGSCPSSAILGGVDYATDNNARVTSNSYGGGGFSQAMKDAIDRADAAGILFSAAAGNNGRDIEFSNFFPAGYDSPNIISVAAMNRFGGKSGFSNWGATRVDLGAPGSSILSTTRNNRYSTFNGTSMACPHVTGAVAYLMGFNPNLGHLEYKQIIMDSAEPSGAMAGRSVTGGTLNIKTALDLTPPLIIPPENVPPVADPAGPYKGRAFRAITFDASGSFDPNAPGGGGIPLDDFVSVYVWDFGDGSGTVTTSSAVTTHTYPSGNNDYVVSLEVKDKFRVTSAAVTTTCRIRGGGKKPNPNRN